MNPTDEELLYAFYAGETAAIEQLAERHDSLPTRLAFQILVTRTGSEAQALSEWDIRERLVSVWSHVLLTQHAGIGSWPHQRLSVLTWFIYLLCLEMDRHLGFRGPF